MPKSILKTSLHEGGKKKPYFGSPVKLKTEINRRKRDALQISRGMLKTYEKFSKNLEAESFFEKFKTFDPRKTMQTYEDVYKQKKNGYLNCGSSNGFSRSIIPIKGSKRKILKNWSRDKNQSIEKPLFTNKIKRRV